jgi:hypothetical protein
VKHPANLVLILLSLISMPAHAQFDEASFRSSLKVKREVYLKEGSFTGGDRNSSDFRVKEIRLAANPAGYDRVVIDFAGNSVSGKSELARPPFYIVELNPENKRVQVTLFGKPKLDFSSQSSIQAARKTKLVSKLEFIPIVNSDRWTWSIETKAPVKAEVFELSNPARVIIDLKRL